MSIIEVNTSKPYKVVIERGIYGKLPEIVARDYPASRVMIITDDIVGKLYSSQLAQGLNSKQVDCELHIIEHGESSKSMANYAAILAHLASSEYTRNDIIVALGGGVVGDLAGFVAATYMRGIRFVQVPTTLLAAIDSSVGGKTAINLASGKNSVGAFHQPVACYIDSELLASLPQSEWQCGIGEAMKYAILEGGEIYQIMSSGEYINDINILIHNTVNTNIASPSGVDIHSRALENGEGNAPNVSVSNIDRLIELAVAAKVRYVTLDEYDNGKRMLLNLGHSYGHAIELESKYTIAHGIAVARGMRYSLDISIKLGLFVGDRAAVNRLIGSIDNEDKLDYTVLNKWLARDKKAEGAAINYIVIRDIGDCDIVKISIAELCKLGQ